MIDVITIYEFFPAGNVVPSTVSEIFMGIDGDSYTQNILNIEELVDRRESTSEHELNWIRISTTKAQDDITLGKLKTAADKIESNEQKYMSMNYNCTGFACDILNDIYPDDSNLGVQLLIPAEIIKVPITVITPNKLWNDLKLKDNVVEKSSDKNLSEYSVILYVINEALSSVKSKSAPETE